MNTNPRAGQRRHRQDPVIPPQSALSTAIVAHVAAQIPGAARLSLPLLAKRVADDVSQLSEFFTSDREELPPAYLSRPATRCAYLLYFGSIGAACVQQALDFAGKWPLVGDRPLRILDVGAGPLVATLGVVERLGPAALVDVTAVDGSRRTMEDGAAVLRAVSPLAKVQLKSGNFREGNFWRDAVVGQYDMILLANVLNEWQMGGHTKASAADFVQRLLQNHLAENGVAVLVEPATRWGSHTLIKVREHLAQATEPLAFRVIAPCCGAVQCPLANNQRDWCFSEQPWRRPAHVEAIDAAIGHRRATLKFSYLVIGHGDSKAKHRVIGGVMRDRGVLRRYVCTQEGRVVAMSAESRAPSWLKQAWRGDPVAIAQPAVMAGDGNRHELVVDVGFKGSPAPVVAPSRSAKTKRS